MKKQQIGTYFLFAKLIQTNNYNTIKCYKEVELTLKK